MGNVASKILERAKRHARAGVEAAKANRDWAGYAALYASFWVVVILLVLFG